MRITFQYQSMLYNKMLSNASEEYNNAQLRNLQGSKLLNPSDAPVNYVSAFSMQRSLDDYLSYSNTSKDADGWMGYVDSQMQSIIKLISEVRDDIAIYGASDGDPQKNKALSEKVLGIYRQLIALGNSEYMGRRVFSGFKTDTPPVGDKPNSITSITNYANTDVKINTSKTFGDLNELGEDEYYVDITYKGDTGYLKLFDSKGRQLNVDSNGSDDTTNGGNNISKTLVFKLTPGAVIDTGRGFSVTLPDDLSKPIQSRFTYTPGSDATYFGDDGLIRSIIGFNQEIPLNLTGRELFYKTAKSILGSKVNTSNGITLSAGTFFKNIDKSKSGTGDSIKVSGTGHWGETVGAAVLRGTEPVSLNMNNTTKEARTLTFGYNSKFYSIEIPEKGYKDMDELVGVIKNELTRAKYIGKQDLVNYEDVDMLESSHYAQIKSLNTPEAEKYQADISSFFNIKSDGDRLVVDSINVGDQVSLSVSGGNNNVLGFNNKTVGAMGKDTVFEIGKEFERFKGIRQVYTTHSNVDLTQNELSFVINGKNVVVKGVNNATTDSERALAIENALRKAGFSNTIGVRIDDNASGGKDITFNLQNINYNLDTYLSTAYYSNNISDYKMASPEKDAFSTYSNTTTIEDFKLFIEDLYDGGVNVDISDGKLKVTDVREGKSNLTIDINPDNKGVGDPIGKKGYIIKGNFSGSLDEKWSIKTDVSNVAGNTNVSVNLYDEKGNLVLSKKIDRYLGEDIPLLNGVSLVLSDEGLQPGENKESNFTLDLRGDTSLSFGDMLISDDGSNANAFVALDNLYSALKHGITKYSLGAPSAWSDNKRISTAKPYFDGKFGGNYNDKFKYVINAKEGRNEGYLQNRYIKETGEIRFKPNLGNIHFKVNIYNNSTGNLDEVSLSIDVSSATSEKDIRKKIVEELEKEPMLYSQGISAYEKDGKIVFNSAGGTQNINIVTVDKDSDFVFGGGLSYGTGSILKGSSESGSFDINYYKNNQWYTATININPFSDMGDMLNELNKALPSDVSAVIDSGKLVFKGASSSVSDVFYSNVKNGSSIGLYNSSYSMVKGNQGVPLDMKSLSQDQRTLSFRYEDASGVHIKSILLEDKEYNNIDEVVKEINSKISTILPSGMEAFSGDGNSIMFSTPNGISKLTVEGDYEGTLGFPKSGEIAYITVTDDSGKLVQNIKADTANEVYNVRDGVMLGFDTGSLSNGDSFTGVVGSGVRYEIDILNKVQNQILEAQTKLGNRHAKVKTVLEFNASMKVQFENKIAKQLGATEEDKIKLISDLTASELALQSALKAVTSGLSMSFSILDLLR